MALGDCYYPPCASPLEFEQVLIGLFGLTDAGCVALKIHLNSENTPTSPCVDMTLQELILNSIVEDGTGGYALRTIGVSGTPECYPCASNDDFESLLKSLFAEQDGCYGLKYYGVASDCDAVNTYTECSAEITAEQLFKQAIVHDSTYGNYLVINQLYGTCTDTLDCGTYLTMGQLMAGLVLNVTGECYGCLNLSAIDYSRGYDPIKECATYHSFEDVFRAAITEIDCGYALNVMLIAEDVQ